MEYIFDVLKYTILTTQIQVAIYMILGVIHKILRISCTHYCSTYREYDVLMSIMIRLQANINRTHN